MPAQAELQLGIQDDALLTSLEPNAWPFAKGLTPKVIRYNIGWEQVAGARPKAPDDPADPAYDFKHADSMARQTAAIGAQSLFTIVNAPRWANGNKAPSYAPANRRRLRPVLRQSSPGATRARTRRRARCSRCPP